MFLTNFNLPPLRTLCCYDLREFGAHMLKCSIILSIRVFLNINKTEQQQQQRLQKKKKKKKKKWGMLAAKF